MPLTPNPLDALKRLLGTSPDLNADDPNGMVAQENRASDNIDELKQHLGLQAEFPHTYFASAKTPTALSRQEEDLAKGPNFGTAAMARKDAIQKANDEALQAGFTGDTNIERGRDAGGQDLYANVGDMSGLSPAQHAGRSATAMDTAKTQMPLLAAREKATGDIMAEREKGAQARETEGANWDRTTKYMQGTGAPSTPAPGPTAPGGPGGPAAAAPQKSQSFMQYLTGTGPRPENSLSSALSAGAERAKYSLMSTPLAPMLQNESFGNLEQLQAQFPGVRGFSYLLPKLKEHQSNFGKGETPDASYNRLHELVGIMHQVEGEMGDPRSHAIPDAHGNLKFSQTPAAIQRAQQAVKDTRLRFETAMQQMKTQFPNLQDPISTQPGQPAQPGASAQPASSRFQRIPEPQ